MTGTSVDAQLAGGLQSEMAIDYLSVTPGEDRDLEPELPDAAAHALHGSVIFSGISGVENQLVYRPGLNLDCICHTHRSPHPDN
jgi:hypothetical protein